jgi:hypothetical protein
LDFGLWDFFHCDFAVDQIRDTTWLSMLAAVASKCGFYPSVSRLSMLASVFTSFASLILVGN